MLDTPGQIEAMIRGSGGVPVVAGAVTTWGHLDTVDELVLDQDGAAMSGTRLVLKVATGILPPLRNRAVLTVDGTSYQVREHAREGDGALTRVLLAKAS